MSPLNRLFYIAKPLIPRQLQILVRRRLAAYKRNKFAQVWPIGPKSATPPKGWTGWPDGRQFALTLIHDVDTIRGYNNVLKLAELEERMGFRSCFSFGPERYGNVSLRLLDDLRERGFDVAVHGLKHDGKLFRSRRSFMRQAPRINAYLKEWKTAGFTSPSMHHNLEWIAALNIQYSISTFDTDPFEPQPDGAGTIFPFVVRRKSVQPAPWNSGESRTIPPGSSEFSVQGSSPPSFPASQPPSFFIELPYTLPQDSTLFIILQERSIDIWKQKLDWISEKGGMALLNTHPDYMNFDGKRFGKEEYPAKYYEDFLRFVGVESKDLYWHCLPRDLALLVSQIQLGEGRMKCQVDRV